MNQDYGTEGQLLPQQSLQGKMDPWRNMKKHKRNTQHTCILHLIWGDMIETHIHRYRCQVWWWTPGLVKYATPQQLPTVSDIIHLWPCSTELLSNHFQTFRQHWKGWKVQPRRSLVVMKISNEISYIWTNIHLKSSGSLCYHKEKHFIGTMD